MELLLEDGALCCPSCGFNYLHHQDVHVYNREEDAESGTLTSVVGNQTRVDSSASMADCPSSRRDGVIISFMCEGCEVKPNLTIVQHKGQTFLSWVY